MSAKKRHPLLWPSMKVRGRRRRALAAERRVRTMIIPFARATYLPNGSVRFDAVAGPGENTFRIENRVTTDGFGRSVRSSR